MVAPPSSAVAFGEKDDALGGGETVNTNGVAASPSDAASPPLGTRENAVLSFENYT